MQITIDLPELAIKSDEIKVLLAIKMFEDKLVSLGAAAEIAGYTERSFADVMTHRKIPPFSFSVEEYGSELVNA